MEPHARAGGFCKWHWLGRRQSCGIDVSLVANRSRTPTLRSVGLLCLVAACACRALRADDQARDSQSHTLTVEARDLATGAAIPGVAVKLHFGRDTKLEAATDPGGHARFQYRFPESDRRRGFFTITAHRDGLVPLVTRWTQSPSDAAPPERLVFEMEKATTIRGRVVDEKGQPLADAVVVVSVDKKYRRTEQRIAVSYESTRTDANGAWSFADVPAEPDSIELAAYHYLCLTEHASFFCEPFKPVSQLRDGSARLTLRRGTIVEGIVRSPGGRPVPDAEVCYGEERGYANSIPPIKTDAQGKFRLGIKPETHATLIATSPGFAPTLDRRKIGDQTLQVVITLDRPHSIRGRVVDSAGKPIARAQIWAYWSGPEASPRSNFGSAITLGFTAGTDGRFEWREAPGRGVRASVSAAGFAGKEGLELASDVDHEITLMAPTTVKGTVVDRQTGQPVARFALTLATQWEPMSPFLWQRHWDLARAANKAPGSFEFTRTDAAHRCLLRVQADGYLPEDSEPFALDGTSHSLTFRLTKADSIRGVVQNPDGSTAREGFVYLVPSHRDGWIDYLELTNDDVSDRERSGTVHAPINADGSFSLPPQRANFALLVLCASGSLRVSRSELSGNDGLRLKPWARVRGSLTLDGKPAADIALGSYDPDESAPVDGEPRLMRRIFVKTDRAGRFELPRVLPGRLTLVQRVPNGVNRRFWAVNRATLDIQGGQSYELAIGTSGRLVTGQLVLPRADIWMIRKAEIKPRHDETKHAAAIGVEVFPGGRVRAVDLKPGDYTLRIALHEPPPGDSCGWGRLLGEYAREFSVPSDGRANDGPLDLGTIKPSATGGRGLQAGEKAPHFALKTLDGRELKLGDFRGRYVLLDFWASWCAPCLAEMPGMLSVQEQFGKDPRFAMIGISLDERPADAASVVKSHGLSWPQGLAGPDSPVVSAYGATAIPATFLIGPDGTVIAKDLRGERTKTAIAAGLKR
jgi:peroxiredoxin